MDYYFLLCRSLTYAQRTISTLERVGISAYLTRMPKTVSVRGCGYGVKLSSRHFSHGLNVLESQMLTPKKIYSVGTDGTYREMNL